MKIIGCIMEINPPHLGHQYFLEQIDKKDDDLLVVVVSGVLTQRGDISVINKHDKAQFLLDMGADIVINLPSILANQGGYYFAKHAINLLKHFKITDLYFGSETNDLEYLLTLSNITNDLNFQHGIYKNQLMELKSNDILGISYLRNISDTNITPHLIKRINNLYNQNTKSTGTIQSATFIRNHLDDSETRYFVADGIFDKIKVINNDFILPLLITNLDYALHNDLNIFLSENKELLYKLDYYIKNNNNYSLDTLINDCSDKNNSAHKLRRLINNIIFLVDSNQVHNSSYYLHVLGLTDLGRKYIKDNKIDIITSLKNNDNYIANKEIMIGKLYQTLTDGEYHQDFIKPIIK